MKSFKNYLYEQDNEKVAAGAILKASDTGRLGLAKRSMKCEHPGTWACLGGSCKDFETPLEACIREIKEEADLDVDPRQLQWIHVFRDAVKLFNYHTFIWHCPSETYINDRIRLDDENIGFIWCTTDTMPQPLHPGFANTVKQYNINLQLKGEFLPCAG